MNITQLIARFRYESGDTEDPYLFTDDELIDLFNEAVAEACTRKDLLLDASTAAVCNIAVTSGTAIYPTHSSIVSINNAYLVNAAGSYTYLALRDRDKIDREYPAWRESTGKPNTLIVSDGSVQLHGPPTESATLYLEVQRIPLESEQMIAVVHPATALSPVIQAVHHKHLHHYPLSIVYDRDDVGYYAPEKAAKHAALFNRYFGDPVPAQRPQENRLNRPVIHNRWW